MVKELLTEPDIGQLGQSSIAKGGRNDLSRWEAFGGTLKRPAPPAPMTPRSPAERLNNSKI